MMPIEKVIVLWSMPTSESIFYGRYTQFSCIDSMLIKCAHKGHSIPKTLVIYFFLNYPEKIHTKNLRMYYKIFLSECRKSRASEVYIYINMSQDE